MMESIKHADHIVFKNNPVQLKSYVDNFVEITTVDGQVVTGMVHTIDPVSETVVLVVYTEDCNLPAVPVSLEFIIGHAIQSICIIASPVHSKKIRDHLFEISWKDKYSKSDIIFRKKCLLDWLKKNLINVEEDGEVLHMPGSFEICPPYDADSCSSLDGNKLIISKVKALVSSVPDCTLNEESSAQLVPSTQNIELT